MDEIKKKIIARIRTQFMFEKTEEFVALVSSCKEQSELKPILQALEKAWENRDYTPPALPPIEKEVFEFEVPTKKVAVIGIIKKMEKELRPAVYNKYLKLVNGKISLEPEDFAENLGKLIRDTLKVTDCTAVESFYVFEKPAQQFGIEEFKKPLMDLISSEYTEYRFKKDTEDYKKECNKKEGTNKQIEEEKAKRSEWELVAIRVLEDEHLISVFPEIENWNILDDDIATKMARLVCVKVNKDKFLLMDPKSLKHTFEVNSKDDVIHYIATQDQYVNPLCITEETKEDKQGDLVTRPLSDIDLFRKHHKIIQETSYDLRSKHNHELARIETREGMKLSVKQSGVKRAVIDPKFYEECDEWLRIISGESYEGIMAWTAHSLDFGVALPILSFLGPPNAGKSLLMMAIQEQLADAEAPLTPVMFEESGFSGELITNPFIVADDGGISITPENRELWTDRLKKYVTDNNRSVNPKYGKKTTLKGNIRSYCAFNHDKQHIRKLFYVPNPALGERVFDVEIPENLKKTLDEFFIKWDVLGEKDRSNLWLQGGKLTRHVAWIIENKADYPVPVGTGRWGNMVGYHYVGELATTRSQQLMLEFLVNSVSDNQSYCRLIDHKESKYIMFNIRTLTEAYKMISSDRKVSEKDFREMIVSLGTKNTPIRIEGKPTSKWILSHDKFLKITAEGDENETNEV